MKDIPIIFSAPMVKGLLSGAKTMTRRLAFRENGKPSPWQRVTPGDRLWVRENFQDHITGIHYTADGDAPGKITPCIHMPRRLSRITMIIEAVKIESLQAITDADAKAEGIVEDDGDTPDIWYLPGAWMIKGNIIQAPRPRPVFESLWIALHGQNSWSDNPKVVAMSGRVVMENIDRIKEAA
jgi:hypothetical protein